MAKRSYARAAISANTQSSFDLRRHRVNPAYPSVCKENVYGALTLVANATLQQQQDTAGGAQFLRQTDLETWRWQRHTGNAVNVIVENNPQAHEVCFFDPAGQQHLSREA